MGKTYRNTRLDAEHGCFDAYYERSGHKGWLGERPLDPEDRARDRAYEKEIWDARRRDGKTHGYHCESATARGIFRTLSKKHIRAASRRALHAGRSGADWDDIVYPESRDGKRFIWAVW